MCRYRSEDDAQAESMLRVFIIATIAKRVRPKALFRLAAPSTLALRNTSEAMAASIMTENHFLRNGSKNQNC